MYSSPPGTVWASRRVNCLDKRAVHRVSWSRKQHRWPSYVIWAYIIANVFSLRMTTRDMWIPEFLVRISPASAVCIFDHVRIRSEFTVPYVQKKLPDVRRLTTVTVTSNSLLTKPLWSGHSSDRVRVSNFMAAYGRGRSLTRDTTVTCRTRFSQRH